MPKIRKDEATGALIFKATPEDLEIRDMRSRIEVLEKQVKELQEINKKLSDIVLEVYKNVRNKNKL